MKKGDLLRRRFDGDICVILTDPYLSSYVPYPAPTQNSSYFVDLINSNGHINPAVNIEAIKYYYDIL